MLTTIVTIGAIPIAVATWHFGPTFSPDSFEYSLMAERMLLGHAQASSLFPPGYPALVAALQSSGLQFAQAALCLNILALLAFTAAVISIAGTLRLSMLARGLACAFLVGHPRLQSLWQAALSDALFLALSTLFIAIAMKLGHAKQVRAGAAALATVFCAMVWVRYAALFAIPVGVTAIVVSAHLTSSRRRSEALLVFLAISLSGLGLLVARNLFTDDTLFGPRQPASDTVLFALAEVVRGWRDWVIVYPAWANGLVGAVTGVACCVALACIVAWQFLGPRRMRISTLVPMLAATGYMAMLIYTQISTVVDPIGGRLLAPALPLISLVAFGLARDCFRGRSFPKYLILGLATIVMLNYVFTVRFAEYRSNHAHFWSTPYWSTAERDYVLNYARRGCLIASDQPSRTIYAIGSMGIGLPVAAIPGTQSYRGSQPRYEGSEFTDSVRSRGVLMILWEPGDSRIRSTISLLEHRDVSFVPGSRQVLGWLPGTSQTTCTNSTRTAVSRGS